MISKNKFDQELKNIDGIKDLVILVDNFQLERKNKVIINMCDLIQSLCMELRLQEIQLLLNNLIHFSTLKQVFTDNDDGKKYI